MDLTTQQLLKKAVALHASDIFIVAGRPASIRLNGSIIIENTERLMPDDTHFLPLSVSFLLNFRIAAKDTFQNASLFLPIIPRDLFW